MDGTSSSHSSRPAQSVRRSAFARAGSDITVSTDRDAAFEAKLARYPKNSREYLLLLREKDYEEFRAEAGKWVICKGC